MKIELSPNSPIKELHEIFDHLDGAERHIIETALRFTARPNSALSDAYLVQGTLSYFEIHTIIDSANDIIDSVLKRKGDLYKDLTRLFNVYFNVYDPESWVRFECVFSVWESRKNGDLCNIWDRYDDKPDWLDKYPSALIEESKWRSEKLRPLKSAV